MDVRVPTLAEGIKSGTIVSVFVSEGDSVKKGQDLFEIETEKAVASISSPNNGKVSKVKTKVGDQVQIGQPLLVLSENGHETAEDTSEQTESAAQPSKNPIATPEPSDTDQIDKDDEEFTGSPKLPDGIPIAASPSVRKMARTLGIDLSRIRGTESGGRISESDVRNYIGHLKKKAQATGPAQKPVADLPDFSKWGTIKSEPMTTLRRKISEKMTESWTTVPHVTQYDDADVTHLSNLVKKHASAFEKKGVKLTMTILLIRALIPVLKKYPIFNASLDEKNLATVYKDFLNFGIAVDTEQGLIVPVIKNVEKKSIEELARELRDLAIRTRQRKVSLDELQGSTFTISNQGGIGGSHFTPIINKPDVAILGIGRAKTKPSVVDGKIVARQLVPLSLSYDHRIIDGGSAARFISELVNEIENFDASQLSESKSEQKTEKKPASKKSSKKASKK